MKLLKFAVNNFRGITGGLDNNSVNFQDSNTIFVFGQNNVGKSSFLKAYKNFYEDAVLVDDAKTANENSDKNVNALNDLVDTHNRHLQTLH